MIRHESICFWVSERRKKTPNQSYQPLKNVVSVFEQFEGYSGEVFRSGTFEIAKAYASSAETSIGNVWFFERAARQPAASRAIIFSK
jgi:hypothetical protein